VPELARPGALFEIEANGDFAAEIAVRCALFLAPDCDACRVLADK
jgi:hypothetical protein